MRSKRLIRRMSKALYWPVILAAVFVTGCASMHVTTNYSRGIDFANYHTYSWLKVAPANSLWADRIKSDVNAQLSAKGWMMVPTGGEASVSAFGSTHDQQSLETFYNSFGPGFGGWGWWGWGWGGWGGPGYSTTQVVNTPVSTLVVDIFNTQTKQMIWRGTASHAISNNPDKNIQKLQNAVADMFKNFPPEKG